MKRCKFLLFVIAILQVHILSAQKIDENSFDKYDSVYTISSQSETINGMMSAGGILKSTVYWRDIRQSQFKSLPHTSYTLALMFKSNSTTSIDEKSAGAKIEFDNGKIVDYHHFGRYKIISSDDLASIAIKIEDDEDPLFSNSIKSIRIYTSRSNQDYDISEKKKDKVKDCLNLVKNEVTKINQ